MVSNNKKSIKSIAIINTLIILAIVVVVNILSSLQYFRLDLTNDKIHTLSKNTHSIIDSIDGIVNVEIYLKDDNLTPEVLNLKKAIEEKINDFRDYGRGKIKYTFVNPSADDINNEEFQKRLIETGLQDVVINVKENNSFKAINIWPCAKVYYADNAANIQFLERGKPLTEGYINGRINEMEYLISKALVEATSKTRKRIAFIEGHGELTEAETWIINNRLTDLNYTERVKIDGKLGALIGFDMVIVAKPQEPFSDKDAYILDQFIMKGGKAIWLIDPLEVRADSLKKTGQTMALGRNLNIENQLFKYGARLNSNLILDKRCAPTYVPGYGAKPYNWYFHPLVSLRENHPISKNISPVKLQYASTVDTVGSPNIKKTVVLETSDFSMHYKAPARINYGVLLIDPNFSSSNNRPHQPVAVLLEGEFKSYFENYANPEFINSPIANFKKQSPENKMIVIGDGDIIRNEIVMQEGKEFYIGLEFEPLFINTQYVQKMYGNTEFFLNAVDYLLGQEKLLQLRSRETTFRPLDENKIKDGKKAFWQFINIVLPLVVLLVLGIIQFIVRRSKFSKK
jgi:ABC-2 type transport system permease protein